MPGTSSTARRGRSTSSSVPATGHACSSDVGARNAGDGIRYPVSELALRHRAGATEEATSGKVAYAGQPETSPGPYPDGVLPDLSSSGG